MSEDEHKALVDSVAGILNNGGFKIQKHVRFEIDRGFKGSRFEIEPENAPPVPAFQIHKGEYGCDSCDATDVPRLFLIAARAKVDLMLCEACKARREVRYGRKFPVKAIYNVLSVVPRDALQAPSRPIMLNTGVSLTFELVSADLAACTLGIVSRACDHVENQPAFSKLTILPPVEGTTRFEVHANEDAVTVDLPALKRALVEALEASISCIHMFPSSRTTS